MDISRWWNHRNQTIYSSHPGGVLDVTAAARVEDLIPRPYQGAMVITTTFPVASPPA